MNTAHDFPFDNSYARELPGFYVAWKPAPVNQPQLLFFNTALADELGLGLQGRDESTLAELFAGNSLPASAEPIAQAYAGHQFGSFSPQLGDGRALLIGELIDRFGRRRDLAFKGSGRTPFSRNGDGKAAVGPMLREVLMGEAMHALGIASTRALAVVGTGEPVYREDTLPGAVLTRVAQSHIRVGTFEYFAARGETERVRRLADYAISRHYPELAGIDDCYLAFLRAVTRQQAALVAQWMHAGFIHGVMNTDNMSIAGETIDYGPCAFVETYDPRAVFSSIDRNGRYAYGNQPGIAQWNLARLAEALLPLLNEDQERAVENATVVIQGFAEAYSWQWLDSARAKLGLFARVEDGDHIDSSLAEDWLDLLEANRGDYTLAWRQLADAAEGRADALRDRFVNRAALDAWLERWRTRCREEDDAASVDVAMAGPRRAKAMRQRNPWIIPRNHRVEEALAAASGDGDLAPFERLLVALRRPYEEHPDDAPYAQPAAEGFTANYQTFCGT